MEWRPIRSRDPSGYRVVGFVDPSHPQQIFNVTTPDSNWREYQGIDFTLESRPNSHWDIYGAYTLSWLYGPGEEEFGQVTFQTGRSAFYNPRLTPFFDGYLTDDVRHHLRLRTSYANHGFSIGAKLEYTSGRPITERFYNYNDQGYTNPRSPQGTGPSTDQRNNPQAVSELRSPDIITVDLRFTYDFNALLKQHLFLIPDLFNLFNLRQATVLEDSNLPTFGQANVRQSPFRFQIGLRYVY